MKVNINFKSLKKGFGYYLIGSAKKGNAEIVIDIDALLNVCVEHKELQFKEIFSETVLHEILHGIEDLYDKSFSHRRIDNAIKKATDANNQRYRPKNIPDGPK